MLTGLSHFLYTQKEHELLARGSGFYVRGPTTGAVIAVVSAHVAAPHRFPRYFPQEWLQHVRDADCRSVLETRSADGKIVTGSIATQGLSSGFRHASLDVAAFVLDESAMSDGKDMQVLTLDAETVRIGVEVVVGGYRLLGESGSGLEAVVGTETGGEVSELVKSRGFVDTGAVDTEMGMCGGPIVLAEERDTCVGILEGLVPRVQEGQKAEGEMHGRVAGHSVFIGARELGMFLQDVETEHVRGGGDDGAGG